MGSATVSRGKNLRPVPAKVTPPEITWYFPRKRLFRLLDAARKRPVIWISAPAGTGKTTLIGSYVDVRRLPCLWYQVDEGDADAATFFYYMGLAAQRAAPHKRKPLPLLTPEYLPNLPAFTQRYFEDLYGRLAPGSVLVFDNCQKLRPDSAMLEVIRNALSGIPSGVNAILISRSDPPPVFARKRAHRLMEVIGWKDLRLTSDETGGIARQRWKGRLRKETVGYLQGKTDGWAAGVVLLLEKYGTDGVDTRTQERHLTEEIFDYFAAEVFDKADTEHRAFLLASAFLPQMTVGMAERLTGQGRARQILSHLNRHNYFTLKYSRGEPVYAYHALFRQFLLSHAKRSLPAEEIAGIQRTAAGLLAEHGHAEDAASLLRECGDREALIRLILSQAPSLASQGRFGTLEEWIRALPPNTLEEIPWLRYWMGVCRMAFDPGESRIHFERAYREFRNRKDSRGIFLSWSGVVESTTYGLVGFKPMDPWLAELDDMIGQLGDFPSPGIPERVSCSMLMAIACTPGETVVSDEEAWMERTLSVARTCKDIPMRAEALITLPHYLMGRDFQKTEMVLDMLRELVKRPDVPLMVRLRLCWSEAVHAIMGGAHDTCMKAVTDGFDIATSTGVHLMDFVLMGHGALCSMITDDAATAKDLMRKMAASLGMTRPFEQSFYHHVSAWAALREGDLSNARFHAEQALKSPDAMLHWASLHLVYLQSAFISFDLGLKERAFADLARSRRIIGGKVDFAEFCCGLAEAFFLLRMGAEEAALAPLRDAMRTGREKGLGGVYQPYPGFLARVAAKALDAGIEVQYVRELIRKNRLVPDPSAVDLESWPWPVKVYTLGRFDLVVGGKVLVSARKTRQKPLLLLKALIALGGRDIHEEQLTEVLWPEADGDLAHQSLAKTLERLREMLGDERAVLLRDGRITLNNRLCWVDVWELERTLGRADAARKPGSHAPDGGEVARLAERAIALYRGTFLSGETFCSYIVTFRERLRSKFLRAVVRAGRHWEQAGEWDKAIACYQKGLEVDPLSEELCRRRIAGKVRLGRHAEAHALFHRFRKTLSTVLGVNPSPDLEASLKSVPVLHDPGKL